MGSFIEITVMYYDALSLIDIRLFSLAILYQEIFNRGESCDIKPLRFGEWWGMNNETSRLF